MELWYLISVYHLMMLNICIKFLENILKGFRVIEGMQFVYTEICKGALFYKNVGGVMVLVLFALSDNALYESHRVSKFQT